MFKEWLNGLPGKKSARDTKTPMLQASKPEVAWGPNVKRALLRAQKFKKDLPSTSK